jgi:HlyD family secretion protein
MIRTLRSRLLRFGVCLLGLILLLAGCPSPNNAVKPPPNKSSPTQVTALGRIEPRNGVILIYAPPGDQVVEVLVGQGNKVSEGEQLLVLRSEGLRSKEMELAQAQFQAAKQQLDALEESGQAQRREAELKRDNLITSANGEIAALELKKGLLEDQYKSASKEANRLKGLTDGVVSPQAKEAQRLAAEALRVQLESTELALKQSKQSLEQNKEEAKARIEALDKSIAQAKAQVSIQAAEINQKLAKTRFEISRITSPIKGVVLDLSMHKGDSTSNLAPMRLADLSQLVVIAEVDQSEVLKVSEGDDAQISSSVLGPSGSNPIKGAVMVIGKMIAPNKLNSLNPAARSDRRVVEVTIELKDLKPQQRKDLERLLGLQVDVKIDLTPKQGPDNEK